MSYESDLPSAEDIAEANAITDDSPDTRYSSRPDEKIDTGVHATPRVRLVVSFGEMGGIALTGALVLMLTAGQSLSTRLTALAVTLSAGFLVAEVLRASERGHPLMQDLAGTLHLVLMASGFLFVIAGGQALGLGSSAHATPAQLLPIVLICLVTGITMGVAFGPFTRLDLYIMRRDIAAEGRHLFNRRRRPHVAARLLLDSRRRDAEPSVKTLTSDTGAVR